MRLYSFILFSIIVLTGISCSEEKLVCGTGLFVQFTFGHFYGECIGEGCVEIFKIEDGKLYEDTLDIYPSSTHEYGGSYIQLSGEKYDAVRDLVDDFPQELYLIEDHVVGQPDAGDWGGIYVEIHHLGDFSRSGYWLLDQHEGNMPQALNDFVDKINTKIALINQ